MIGSGTRVVLWHLKQRERLEAEVRGLERVEHQAWEAYCASVEAGDVDPLHRRKAAWEATFRLLEAARERLEGVAPTPPFFLPDHLRRRWR